MANNCKGCTERFPGCHDKCEIYAEWKAELEKRKAARKAEVDHQNNRVIWSATIRKRVMGK